MSTTVDHVTEEEQIPDAPFYVVSTDRFMSGWGHAEGKTNVLVFPCDDATEAKNVMQNAKDRSDQEGVHIVSAKPEPSDDVFMQVKEKGEGYDTWYSPDRPLED